MEMKNIFNYYYLVIKLLQNFQNIFYLLFFLSYGALIILFIIIQSGFFYFI